jgi:hypothetical protein
LIAIGSFLLNIYEVKSDAVGAFYSPLTRFWELLSGGILAYLLLPNKMGALLVYIDKKSCLFSFIFNRKIPLNSNYSKNWLSVIGAFLLLYGFTMINSSYVFPGIWALIPVLGTCLIIYSGPYAWFNVKILSNRLITWVGLISFPLYLWHWPFLTFARIIEGEAVSVELRLCLLTITIVFSWLTYRFVEYPIRNGKLGAKKVVVLSTLLTLIGVAGLIIYINDGFQNRKNATLHGFKGDIGHLEFHKYIAENFFICTPDVIAKEALRWESYTRCMQSKKNTDIDIVLLGDSHAEHLFLGIAKSLPNKNIAFYIKGAPPFVDQKDFKNIFQEIESSKSIKTVILAMHWIGRLGQVPKGSSLEHEISLTINKLESSGKKVILIDDVPTFPFSPDQCKGRRWLSSKNPNCEISRNEFNKQVSSYIDILKNISENNSNVKLIEIGKYICDDFNCSMSHKDEIFYRDANHLNINGSLYVGERFVKDHHLYFYP